MYWAIKPDIDQFAEVRRFLSDTAVIAFEKKTSSRIKRKLKKIIINQSTNKDLFQKHNIDVLFPVLPCEKADVPLVFWCADLQHIHFPELFSIERINNLDRHNNRHIEQAHRIVVSSNTVRKDLLAHYSNLEARIDVAHFCSTPTDNWWQSNPSQVAQSFDLPDRFFIVCNQFSAHKNHIVLLKAINKLKSEGKNICLVCTGKFADYHGTDYVEKIEAYIQKHSLQSNIRIMGILPREQQIALIRRSLAMLQPSRFEGWSTLIEDALTLGKQIIASNIDVNKEQLGEDFEYLIAPDDVDAWALALEESYEKLSPGPNLDNEKSALEKLMRKSQIYGERFIKIFQSVKLNS